MLAVLLVSNFTLRIRKNEPPPNLNIYLIYPLTPYEVPTRGPPLQFQCSPVRPYGARCRLRIAPRAYVCVAVPRPPFLRPRPRGPQESAWATLCFLAVQIYELFFFLPQNGSHPRF